MFLLLTGCGKVPKLANGQDAVVSLNGGGISVDDLYNEMKSDYALGVLLNMVDEKILNEEYPTSDEEKLYYVQVGAFRSKSNAEAFLLTVKEQYPSAFIKVM